MTARRVLAWAEHTIAGIVLAALVWSAADEVSSRRKAVQG